MKYTPVPNDTPKVEQDYYHLEKYDSDCPICGIRSFSHLHRVGTLPKDLERVYEEGKDYDTFEAKDTPTYSARVTHKHEWHCPKCEFGCYSDKESEQMSPLIKEHQNSHKDTPKETWHDKLIRLPCVMTFSQIDGEQLEAFIAHELELARREFVEEAIERIMKCRKDIIKYQNTTDILSKAVTKHEKAWINSGFRLALESTNELLAYYLATLREEKEGK